LTQGNLSKQLIEKDKMMEDFKQNSENYMQSLRDKQAIVEAQFKEMQEIENRDLKKLHNE